MHGPTVGDVLAGWTFDPATALLTASGAALYLRGVIRLARRGRSWPLPRLAAFAIAVVAAILATQSGIGRYDTDRLSIHMVQHLLLGMVAPFAIVSSAPITLAIQSGGPGTGLLLRKALRHPVFRLAAHPVVAWALFGGGIVAIYFTPILGLSARNDFVHLAVHVHLVTVGCIFLAGLVGPDPSPRPLPHPARLLSALTAVPFHAFLGIAMLTARAPLSPEYPSIADQRTAAGILWGAGELFTLAIAAVVVRRWYLSEARAAARHDRQHPAPTGTPRTSAQELT